MRYWKTEIETHLLFDEVHGGLDLAQGGLSVFEAQRDIPFPLRGFRFACGAGDHGQGRAQKTLWQFLFCPYGCICVQLDDGCSHTDTVLLDRPNAGLVLGPGVWYTLKWQQADSVLCTAASAPQEAADAIEDYQAFVRCAQAGPEGTPWK